MTSKSQARRKRQRERERQQKIDAEYRRQHTRANVIMWIGRIVVVSIVAYLWYASVLVIYRQEVGNWLISSADQYSHWKPVVDMVRDFGGWIASVLTFLFGSKRRKGCVQKVEVLTTRNAYLEGLLDGQRTSSRMPANGTTRKGDI